MSSFFIKNGYKRKVLNIDDYNYEVYVKRKVKTPVDYPRLALVVYQPTDVAREIVRLCIETYKKFTDSPHELWIIEDYSPEKYLDWLDEIENINLAFNRTPTKLERGSYSNAISLEIAARLIEPDSKYLMSLHCDTVVCRYGWLKYLMSKFDENTGTVGFRLTKFRTPKGALHVCGYIMDFQLFKKYNLDFFAEYPQLDISDKVSYYLREYGYKIFATPNTFDNSETIEKIPKTLEVSSLNVTRAFDDDWNIIFMHLGRGIPKAQGKYFRKEVKESVGKCGPDEWIEYVKKRILSYPYFVGLDEQSKKIFLETDISIKDAYLRKFFNSIFNRLPKSSNVLYVGYPNRHFNFDSYKELKITNILPDSFNLKMLSEFKMLGKDFDTQTIPSQTINFLKNLSNQNIRSGNSNNSYIYDDKDNDKNNVNGLSSFNCVVFNDVFYYLNFLEDLIKKFTKEKIIKKGSIFVIIYPYIFYDDYNIDKLNNNNSLIIDSLKNIENYYKSIVELFWKLGYSEVSCEIIGSFQSLLNSVQLKNFYEQIISKNFPKKEGIYKISNKEIIALKKKILSNEEKINNKAIVSSKDYKINSELNLGRIIFAVK